MSAIRAFLERVQVALAGIPESVVADATQKPTGPDPSSDGSQNALGAADISCVLAPEHQNRHEDAGTNRKVRIHPLLEACKPTESL